MIGPEWLAVVAQHSGVLTQALASKTNTRQNLANENTFIGSSLESISVGFEAP